MDNNRIEAYLTTSSTGNWMFSANAYQANTFKTLDGKSHESLSPVSSQDLRKLPANARTIAILPPAWASKSREEVVKLVGEVVHMDYTTGAIYPIKD
jgi:hypothetical protein